MNKTGGLFSFVFLLIVLLMLIVSGMIYFKSKMNNTTFTQEIKDVVISMFNNNSRLHQQTFNNGSAPTEEISTSVVVDLTQ